MKTESPKSALLGHFARVARVLGNAHRLELIELLAQGERGVEELARLAGMSFGNASQHLQRLRAAGLVESRPQGKRVFYRLSDEAVVPLLAALRRIAERNLAEVERLIDGYFGARDALEPMSRKDLVARLRAGTVTVLDVRPPEEFAAGHLPGAVNVPLKDLESRLAELPPGQEVVAYCRGPYCVLSFDAVALLRGRGRPARRLEDGFPEWKAAGLPIERKAAKG